MKESIRQQVLRQCLRSLARDHGWLEFFRALKDVAEWESAKTAFDVATAGVAAHESHTIKDSQHTEQRPEPAGSVPAIQ